MDVVRTQRRPVALRGFIWFAAIAACLAAAFWTLPALFGRHAAFEPALSRDSIVVDTVTEGTLERSVTAAGTLLPDRVHVVATQADGVIAELRVRAGSRVSDGSVVATLSNPELAVAVAGAAAQLAAARAEVRSASQEAAASRLDEQAALRSARAENMRAAIEANSDSQLHAHGLIGDVQFQSAVIKSAEDGDLVSIARSKVSVGAAEASAKIAAAQALVAQLDATLAARRAQLATLAVHAGASGIVQSLAVDPGQRVTSGTELARIADEADLKAVLQVAEGDMRGIAPGMLARVSSSDAREIGGHVSRIAPAAQNGTVAVDVALDRLPAGARAAANVDGTIVLRRLRRALSLARPPGIGDASHTVVYRLDRDGTRAYRTPIVMAPGSDDRIQILSGLVAGDRAIVSDTSALDAPALRIKP